MMIEKLLSRIVFPYDLRQEEILFKVLVMFLRVKLRLQRSVNHLGNKQKQRVR